ncbi:MAG: ABC transporter permease [Candidatus Bathyarchaeota archaeon]|nr:ABC transporter permease [Candidatus Bathyarchaeota archaeon]
MASFFSLLRWELEEYLSFPVLAFLIVSAIAAVLFQTNSGGHITSERSYISLFHTSGTVFLFLTFCAGVFFSRSFAGAVGKGETKLMLSYPVKRWQLFLSKFTALFPIIFVIYGAAYALLLYFNSISVFEPMFFVTLLAFLLQLMLTCGVSVAVAMVTKSEIISILASLLFLLGIDSVGGAGTYLSAQGRLKFLFSYFGDLIHPDVPPFTEFSATAGDAATAVVVPVVIFLVLFVAAFVYFTRFMEVD